MKVSSDLRKVRNCSPLAGLRYPAVTLMLVRGILSYTFLSFCVRRSLAH